MVTSSSRLVLRQFREDDASLIYELNRDAEVLRYVHELPVESLAAAHEHLVRRILPQYARYGYGRWAVLVAETGEFIGWCGLKYRPERKETDLGYRFKRSAWGKGYATEAAAAAIQYGFETLGLPVITAMAHIENTASLKILEKLGFRFTGHEVVDSCPVKTYSLERAVS